MNVFIWSEDRIKALVAENARLREALHTIEQSEHPDAPTLGDGSEADFGHALVLIARAALAERA